MLEAYGAYGEKMLYGKKSVGVIRSTFVVDPDGKIEQAQYAVKATGHVAQAAQGARRLTERVRRVAGIWGRSPTAEAQDLGSCQCGFESHRPHKTRKSGSKSGSVRGIRRLRARPS